MYTFISLLIILICQFVHIGLFLQLLGHTQEAIEAYTDIIKRNLADESSLAVATNNIVSLKGPKDVSDSLRKLDRLIEKGTGPPSFQLAHGLDLKLSSKQREAIYGNRVLLLLHSNKMDQVLISLLRLSMMFFCKHLPPTYLSFTLFLFPLFLIVGTRSSKNPKF